MRVCIFTYGLETGLEHEKVALQKGATHVQIRPGYRYKPSNGVSIDFDVAMFTRGGSELESHIQSLNIPIVGLDDDLPKLPEPVPVWFTTSNGIYTGKRVALVGPAEHITRNKVDLSDYDLIVRMNYDFDVKGALAKATTNRIDVWYPSGWACMNLPDAYESDDIKHIRADKLPEGKEHLANKTSKRKYSGKSLMPIVGCYPNTGIIAMVDILSEQPKELYVCGIDFYTGKKPYRAGYSTKEQVDFHKKTKGNHGTHDQGAQIEFFKKHIAPHIGMDSVLEAIVHE